MTAISKKLQAAIDKHRAWAMQEFETEDECHDAMYAAYSESGKTERGKKYIAASEKIGIHAWRGRMLRLAARLKAVAQAKNGNLTFGNESKTDCFQIHFRESLRLIRKEAGL